MLFQQLFHQHSLLKQAQIQFLIKLVRINRGESVLSIGDSDSNPPGGSAPLMIFLIHF